ncbi:MAG: hypothetical protein LBT05_06240, partial [Planctomycetaceae bacterium]|nr:hypothetical protein [Planctomycetaceae bacterium]
MIFLDFGRMYRGGGVRNMANKPCFTYCNALSCPRYYESFCSYNCVHFCLFERFCPFGKHFHPFRKEFCPIRK